MSDNNFLEFHKRKYVAVKPFESQQLQEGARILHYLSPVFTYAPTNDTKRKKEEYMLNNTGIHMYPVELEHRRRQRLSSTVVKTKPDFM